jgi:hypothetical protein
LGWVGFVPSGFRGFGFLGVSWVQGGSGGRGSGEFRVCPRSAASARAATSLGSGLARGCRSEAVARATQEGACREWHIRAHMCVPPAPLPTTPLTPSPPKRDPPGTPPRRRRRWPGGMRRTARCACPCLLGGLDRTIGGGDGEGWWVGTGPAGRAEASARAAGAAPPGGGHNPAALRTRPHLRLEPKTSKTPKTASHPSPKYPPIGTTSNVSPQPSR